MFVYIVFEINVPGVFMERKEYNIMVNVIIYIYMIWYIRLAESGVSDE
jgi:hypothetical protein